MAYATRLGIIPTIIADVPAILNQISSLFTGSSYDATHQQILTWSQAILNDPTLSTFAGQDAWVRLRCWAGDQSVITPANTQELFGGGSVAQGCGCEVAHGCRADAQATVAHLRQVIPSLTTGVLSSSPTQNGSGSGSSGTIPVNVGPLTVGLGVSPSTILNSQLFGIPIWALGVGAGIALFAGKRRRA